MASKAQLVREALITEVKKVSGIGEVGSRWNLWDKVQRFPAACVILDEDEKSRAPTRSKTVIGRHRIACTLQSDNPQDDFDDLRAAIETEIEDDPTLGGLAIDAVVVGCGRFATAPEISDRTYVRNIFVDVEYRHDRGAP